MDRTGKQVRVAKEEEGDCNGGRDCSRIVGGTVAETVADAVAETFAGIVADTVVEVVQELKQILLLGQGEE